MPVDGETLLFATPGDPVAQIRLPQVMEAVFAHLGVNATWVTMHVDAAGLPAVREALRVVRKFRRMTVAIPHKTAIGALLDRVSERAAVAGSVNLVRLDPDGALYGDIADGEGFAGGLEAEGHSIAGASAWVVGADGGGSAIAAALAERGAKRLWLSDVDHRRAEALAARLGAAFPECAIAVADGPPLERVDLAVNATPSGLQPADALPFEPVRLHPVTLVCDIIMKPRETALLAAARAAGLRTHEGHYTLDQQIPLYLDFFGIPFVGAAEVIRVAAQA